MCRDVTCNRQPLGAACYTAVNAIRAYSMGKGLISEICNHEVQTFGRVTVITSRAIHLHRLYSRTARAE